MMAEENMTTDRALTIIGNVASDSMSIGKNAGGRFSALVFIKNNVGRPQLVRGPEAKNPSSAIIALAQKLED